jgi:hypothetical protein
MDKAELNEKFETLNDEVNRLWDSSKFLQDQSREWKDAWHARFEVSRDLHQIAIREGREESKTFMGFRDAHPLGVDPEFRFREQNAGVFNER